MNECLRCGALTIFTLCDVCFEESSIDNLNVSEYDKRLDAGFALMDADENPTDYNDLWS